MGRWLGISERSPIPAEKPGSFIFFAMKYFAAIHVPENAAFHRGFVGVLASQ